MTTLERFLLFLRNADGGGDGGGGGDPGAGGGGDPGGGDPGGAGGLAGAARKIADGGAGDSNNGNPGGGDPDPNKPGSGNPGDPPAPYYPEGLAEPLRGQSDRETIDKLAAEVSGRPRPPAKPDDYKVELSEDLAKAFPDIADDKVMGLWRNIAHKHGLSQEQFINTFSDLYTEMTKSGLIDEPIDFQKEIEMLAPKDERDPKRALASAAQRVNRIADTIKGLHTRGLVDKADVVVLSSMHATADAVKSFEKILQLIPGEHGVQGGGDGATGGVTRAEVEKMMLDPRYDATGDKFDKDYYRRVQDLFRQTAA